MQSYQNFVAGVWTPKSGQTFQTRNPADQREVVAEYPSSSKEETQAAIRAAAEAFPA